MQVEDLPDEEKIAEALFCYSGDIYDSSDVKRFLEINDYTKPNNVRFICWLIANHVVPSERVKWMPGIMKEIKYYHRCAQRYLGTQYITPTVDLRPKARLAIEKGFNDIEPWFQQFCRAYYIDELTILDSKVRLQRISSILSYDSNGFQFEEGYEYFISICYFICLSFQVKSGLPPFFSEAISFSLARNFLSVIAFNRNLYKLNANQDHIDDIYRLSNQYCSQAVKSIKKAGKDVFEISYGWENLLWVDQHSPYNLLMVWDHLCIRIDNLRTYLLYLDIAHLKAMEESNIDFSNEQEIYDMLWDATAILEYADSIEYNANQPSMTSGILANLCPCFPFLFFFRSKKKKTQ